MPKRKPESPPKDVHSLTDAELERNIHELLPPPLRYVDPLTSMVLGPYGAGLLDAEREAEIDAIRNQNKPGRVEPPLPDTTSQSVLSKFRSGTRAHQIAASIIENPGRYPKAIYLPLRIPKSTFDTVWDRNLEPNGFYKHGGCYPPK